VSKRQRFDPEFNQKMTWYSKNSLACLSATQHNPDALKKGLPQGGIRPVNTPCLPIKGWKVATKK
jgi:hypothetical protein